MSEEVYEDVRLPRLLLFPILSMLLVRLSHCRHERLPRTLSVAYRERKLGPVASTYRLWRKSLHPEIRSPKSVGRRMPILDPPLMMGSVESRVLPYYPERRPGRARPTCQLTSDRKGSDFECQ